MNRSAVILEYIWIGFAAVTLVVADASATTLYKHIDKDGKVTYTDRPPADATGKAITIPIDQNTLAPPPPKQDAPPRAREETEYEKIIRRKAPEKSDAELVNAKKRLEDARTALQVAQDSGRPEDWIRRPGGAGGTTLRYPTPEYAERLANLEADVKAAEENLADVERKMRMQ